MVGRAAGGHGSGALHQVRAQVVHLEAGHFIYKITTAFPGVQLVHHVGVVGYINICFVAAVKNAPVMAADLAAGRHLNDQQRAAVYGAGFRLQVQRRIDFLPVVDGSHEVFFHTVNRIRGNTQNLPVVFDAQENDSTVSVGKRTDGIVNILCNLSGGFLKLHPDVLAVLDQLQKFGFCHRSNSPLSSWFYTFLLLYEILHAISNAFPMEGGKVMATTRIMPLHAGKGRTVGKAISDIIDYVKNPDKTDHGRLITSYQCDSRVADAQFLLDKQTYAARTGRVRGKDDVIAYHLRQSFVPGEITPEEANRLGVELARRFTKGKHAFIVCTHIDKSHTHNHVIWNSTTLECDRKFRNFWGSTRAVHRLSDTICIENGYSIVEAPKRHGQSYNKWLSDAAK